MYPNKPVNYLKKAIVARRVAVVSIVIALVCVLMCVGYAKQSNEGVQMRRQLPAECVGRVQHH